MSSEAVEILTRALRAIGFGVAAVLVVWLGIGVGLWIGEGLS